MQLRRVFGVFHRQNHGLSLQAFILSILFSVGFHLEIQSKPLHFLFGFLPGGAIDPQNAAAQPVQLPGGDAVKVCLFHGCSDTPQ